MSGWRVFDGKAPAPSLKETSHSSTGASVASLAAATAKARTGKLKAARQASRRALTPQKFLPKDNGMGTLKFRIDAESDDTMFVPLLAKLLCQAVLDLGGFEQEGIFRKAGSRKDAEAIRDLIHKGDYTILHIDANSHRRDSTGSTISTLSSASGSSHSGVSRSKTQLKDAHVAADILKQWLREMPEPLIEYRLYNRAIDAGNRKSAREAATVVWDLCAEHRQTLLYLLKFFRELMKTESKTKMGAAQIAIVIMPNIIKSEQLGSNPAMAIMNANAEKDFVKVMLENFEEIVQCPM